MIELAMVRRMIRRALLLAVPSVLALFLFSGPEGALSAAAGVGLLVLNLFLAGRVLGGLAENKPELLVVGAMASLFIGLAIVVISGVVVGRAGVLDFAVTGLVFALGHLVVSTWEAADQFLKIPNTEEQKTTARTATTGS